MPCTTYQNSTCLRLAALSSENIVQLTFPCNWVFISVKLYHQIYPVGFAVGTGSVTVVAGDWIDRVADGLKRRWLVELPRHSVIWWR